MYRLQETQSALQTAQQDYGQASSLNVRLQTELQQLVEELQRNESMITDAQAEKATLKGQVKSCLEELEAAKEELRIKTEQTDHTEQVRMRFITVQGHIKTYNKD